MTQAAADVLLGPLDTLGDADVPRVVKDSLRKSVIAIATGYGEDDNPQKVSPDAASFDRLLKFLEHPHRWSWPPPALAISLSGVFTAIWDRPGTNRWLLEFPSEGPIMTTHIETNPDGRMHYSSEEVDPMYEVQPPFSLI